MPSKLSDVAEPKHHPIIFLTSKELPELKKYDLGETYTALYQCKVKGKHVNDSGEVSGDLEIIDIKALPYGSISKAMKGLKND